MSREPPIRPACAPKEGVLFYSILKKTVHSGHETGGGFQAKPGMEGLRFSAKESEGPSQERERERERKKAGSPGDA